MTEAQNWMFYRLTVGSGTLFLGIAAILACVYLYRIAEATSRLANIASENLYHEIRKQNHHDPL